MFKTVFYFYWQFPANQITKVIRRIRNLKLQTSEACFSHRKSCFNQMLEQLRIGFCSLSLSALLLLLGGGYEEYFMCQFCIYFMNVITSVLGSLESQKKNILLLKICSSLNIRAYYHISIEMEWLEIKQSTYLRVVKIVFFISDLF